MKKYFMTLFVLIAATAAFAQPGKKTVPAVKSSETKLKSMDDSVSYAIGLSVVNFYKQQGITKMNTNLVSKSINDVLSGKKPAMDDATANRVMNDLINRMSALKSKPNIDSGEIFLKRNKTRPGVVTTGSGLQYEVIREGNGPHPSATDSVTCNYKGTLVNGTVFDNSYDRGAPITFSLGGVIKGWTEGLQLMTEGSKYKFYVPYQLGYGPNDYGPIPGGSMLTFEVELLKVIKKQL